MGLTYNNSFGMTSVNFNEEKKVLERMKRKNEMELIGKVQYELKKELLKKQGQEKLMKQNEKMKKYQRTLYLKRKEEEMQHCPKGRKQENEGKNLRECKIKCNFAKLT